ncbi:TA system toxin CbtA family protein, partial [Escherichia coli]
LKTSIKTITYLSDIGCLEIQGASLFSACTRSQLINSIDILRARRATGLMTRDNYRTVNNITLGKHPEKR